MQLAISTYWNAFFYKTFATLQTLYYNKFNEQTIE